MNKKTDIIVNGKPLDYNIGDVVYYIKTNPRNCLGAEVKHAKITAVQITDCDIFYEDDQGYLHITEALYPDKTSAQDAAFIKFKESGSERE